MTQGGQVFPMLSFRPAAPADLAQLADLINSAYRGDASRAGWTTEADLLDGQRTDIAGLSALMATPGHTLLLAMDGSEQLVGCAHTIVEPGQTLYFGMLTVDPSVQARGIGRALLDYLEAYGGSAGCNRLRMTVIHLRAELMAWYERRGFQRTGQTLPFPMGDPRFGQPRVAHLELIEFTKALSAAPRLGVRY